MMDYLDYIEGYTETDDIEFMSDEEIAILEEQLFKGDD